MFFPSLSIDETRDPNDPKQWINNMQRCIKDMEKAPREWAVADCLFGLVALSCIHHIMPSNTKDENINIRYILLTLGAAISIGLMFYFPRRQTQERQQAFVTLQNSLREAKEKFSFVKNLPLLTENTNTQLDALHRALEIEKNKLLNPNPNPN